MPYYIYQVKPFAQLEKLAELATFQEASLEAKSLRSNLDLQASEKVKVIFADDAWQAEDLLCQVRTPSPRGDD